MFWLTVLDFPIHEQLISLLWGFVNATIIAEEWESQKTNWEKQEHVEFPLELSLQGQGSYKIKTAQRPASH